MTDLPELKVAFETLEAGNRMSRKFYDLNDVLVIESNKVITQSQLMKLRCPSKRFPKTLPVYIKG